jgi:hypothetical protein
MKIIVQKLTDVTSLNLGPVEIEIVAVGKAYMLW